MFQSAPLLRGAIFPVLEAVMEGGFQSAPLLRGAISRGRPRWWMGAFQSAPLLRGAMAANAAACHQLHVSIRAPLARGDGLLRAPAAADGCFNPRPSCEGRSWMVSRYPQPSGFQSAPLLRGAIRMARQHRHLRQVSIRAPLARGDDGATRKGALSRSFNPRPSCEGRSERQPTWQPGMMFQSAPLLRGAIAHRIASDWIA